MLKWITAIIILILPLIAFAQGELVVLNGLPLVQATCSIEDCKHFTLSESQRLESRVLITKKNNKYLWASRGNRELTKSQSGAFTIFTETSGAGYIRIAKAGDKVLYTEHMGLALETISYWGIANDFIP